jgi:hypothetical protein
MAIPKPPNPVPIMAMSFIRFFKMSLESSY